MRILDALLMKPQAQVAPPFTVESLVALARVRQRRRLICVAATSVILAAILLSAPGRWFPVSRLVSELEAKLWLFLLYWAGVCLLILLPGCRIERALSSEERRELQDLRTDEVMESLDREHVLHEQLRRR